MYTDDTKQLFNKSEYSQRRAALRVNQARPEELLWQKIRSKQLGVKFRRQHGIGKYIVDFYCAECALVVELDGDGHFTPDTQEYDKIRDTFLNGSGFTILRFTNQQIMNQMGDVLLEIIQALTT